MNYINPLKIIRITDYSDDDEFITIKTTQEDLDFDIIQKELNRLATHCGGIVLKGFIEEFLQKEFGAEIIPNETFKIYAGDN